MKIPAIEGIIDRRLLINFTVDPLCLQQVIPAPFRPTIYNEKAIVGICLIRLKNIRPKGLPAFIGIGSENAAHRIAVEWNDSGALKEGVFIPRRDTSSLLNAFAGGRVFPGKHFRAKFDVNEGAGKYSVAFKSSDDTSISIDAEETTVFPLHSIFKTLEMHRPFLKKALLVILPTPINSMDWY